MTIQQLQYALAVYKAGSISGAAASLYIAQPNLSGMIRSLEEELGYPIFVRTSRGVKPTDRGLEALRQAAQMIQCHEKMRLLGNAAARERFRLGGIPYPPACDAFVALCRENEELSQLELSYYCDDPEAAWDKLLMSELDMVLSLCSPEAGERLLRQCAQQGLSARHLVDVPVVLRIGPNHPLYHAPEIHLSDFEGYTLVDYNRRTFLDVPNLSALMKIDPDRVITVSDRSMKYAREGLKDWKLLLFGTEKVAQVLGGIPHAHNSYLEILLRWGLPAMLAAVAMTVEVLLCGVYVVLVSRDGWKISVALMSLAWLPVAMMEKYPFCDNALGGFFLLGAGYLLSWALEERKNRKA